MENTICLPERIILTPRFLKKPAIEKVAKSNNANQFTFQLGTREIVSTVQIKH